MKSVYQLKMNHDYAIKLDRIKEGEKISFVSDTMFEVMLNHEYRIKYASFLIRHILGLEVKSIKLKKPMLDKENVYKKGRRVDFVCEIENKVINIEMNNNPSFATVIRNFKYATDLFQQEVKRGEDYRKEEMVIQINFNNFSYGENCPVEETFRMMSDQRENSLLENFQIVNIYLPEIRRKYYNEGEITEVEKMLLVMMETSVEEAKKIGKGRKLMEEYIKDSVRASKDYDTMEIYYGELNDRIMRNSERKEFFDNGKEEGKKSKSLEIAKKMLERGLALSFVSEMTGLALDEVSRLQEKD